MITLDLPPQIEYRIQSYAKQQGVSVNDYIINSIYNQLNDESAFDIELDLERMQKAIKGCETKELALKNGTLIPKGLAGDFEAFDKWMKSRASTNV